MAGSFFRMSNACSEFRIALCFSHAAYLNFLLFFIGFVDNHELLLLKIIQHCYLQLIYRFYLNFIYAAICPRQDECLSHMYSQQMKLIDSSTLYAMKQTT